MKNEIVERLKKEIALQKELLREFSERYEAAAKEIERLRAALESVKSK